MKTPSFFALAALVAASTTLSRGVTILSQNFDTDPVNYANPTSPFAFQASDPTRYWGLSNMGMSLNPGIAGNNTVYLAGQNMDGDGDGTLTFSTGAPAFLDFNVSVAGYTDLTLSIDLAGLPSVEVENFIRASVDSDGDGFYELMLFNFTGAGNTPYMDATLGALTGDFAPFSNIVIPNPTAPDGMLRLRLEVFNDTQSQNEAAGVDNILISGTIPEPGSVMLALAGGVCLISRRRRKLLPA